MKNALFVNWDLKQFISLLLMLTWQWFDSEFIFDQCSYCTSLCTLCTLTVQLMYMMTCNIHTYIIRFRCGLLIKCQMAFMAFFIECKLMSHCSINIGFSKTIQGLPTPHRSLDVEETKSWLEKSPGCFFTQLHLVFIKIKHLFWKYKSLNLKGGNVTKPLGLVKCQFKQTE